MKKHLFTLMCIMTGFIMAHAATFEVGNFIYTTQSNGTVTCLGWNNTAGAQHLTSLTIPGRVTYNGTEYRVSSVASSAFINDIYIVSVRLGWGIETIGERAFRNCTRLANVTLPSSLTSIQSNAFSNCNVLSSFRLSSATPPTLGSNVFDDSPKCSVVTSCYSYVSAYNAISIWQNIDSDGKVSYDGSLANDFNNNGRCYVYTSPVSASSGNAENMLVGITDNVTSLTIASNEPDYTNQIYGGGTAFYSSTNKVGNSACENKTNLTAVYVTNLKADIIEDYAFRYCTNLATVKLCGSNLTVGSYAFAHCTKLTTLDLMYAGESTSISTLRSFAFLDTGVSEVHIPENLKTYGIGAFASCPNLTTFTVSANNANFRASSNGALYSKSYLLLYQVGGASTISNTIAGCRTIMNYAWYGNTKVSHIEVHYGVTKIQGNAFGKMPNLKSVKIPSSVTNLASDALNNLTNIETIYINLKTPPSVELSNLNPECKTVNIPYGCYSAYHSQNKWNNFTNYYYGAYDIYTNQLYYSIESVGSYTDNDVMSTPAAGQATLVPGWRAYTHGTIGDTWTIPGTIKDIDDNIYIVSAIEKRAFVNNKQLTGMKGGNGIKKIGAMAFYGCSGFTNYGFRYVKQIGDSAFYNCTSLSTIDFGDKLESLGVRAFYGCTSLSGEIIIPAKVSLLGNYCFADCSNLNSLFLYCKNTAIRSRFFLNNASNFKCWVPLANLYNIYIWADWTNSNGTQAKNQFMPYVIPNYGWTAISCFRPIELPSNGTFYYIGTINDGKAIAATKTGYAPSGFGLLLKGKMGEIYRLPIVSTAYGSNNMLKGVEGASATVAPTASNDFYYFDEELRVFHRIKSSRTILSGSAYLQVSSGLYDNIIHVDEMEYPLTIAGVRVTERNKDHITGEGITGYIRYIPSLNQLTLQDAHIDITNLSENAINYDYGGAPNFTITPTGTNNTIMAQDYKIAINIGESQGFTINGIGKLTCGGALYLDAYKHITNECTMSYIKDCTLSVHDIISEDYEEGLTINNANVTCEYLNVGGDHNGQDALTLIDCYVAYPKGGYTDNGCIFVDHEVYQGHVEIKKGSGPNANGDVNGDGAVNVTDITTLVNMILNVIPKDLERGDIDGNGAINVSDVTALVNIILKQ